jgi:phage tail protein X
MLVIALQNDTVDAMCHRHYGRTSGAVETVLEANPGLADHGVILPHGLAVEMPDLPQALSTPSQVNLWD